MAPKRKADDGGGVKNSKRTGETRSERPLKKPRPEDKVDRTGDNLDTKPKKQVNPPSLLKDEERAFPRGGAGVLTPLEHKQIQIQATKDVLFEESGRKRAKGENDIGERDEDGVGDAGQVKAKKKRVKSKSKHTESDSPVESSIRVRGLKFKRLTIGSMILGQVTKITANELILDLPNNLTGRVSINNVSDLLNERLTDIDEEVDDAQEIAATDLDMDIDLKHYFFVGQYLRTYVLSTQGEPEADGSKSRKRIDLSLNPRLTNLGIEPSELKVNFVVQASISSVADYGFGMDMGFQDGSISGFMSSKELPTGIDKNNLGKGAVFLCSVTGLSSNGKIIKLSANLSKTGDLRKVSNIPDAVTVTALLPGTAVELLISQVSAATIAGHVMGSLDASVDLVHSGGTTRKSDVELKHKMGDRINARVLFTIADEAKPVLGLSILDHILSFVRQSLTENKTQKLPTDMLPIGSIVEKSKVLNVEPALGAFADVGKRNIPAFVHISRASDERVETLSATTGPYKTGTTHKARIIGYNAMDGTYLASYEKSVIEQTFLRLEDVPVGEVVKATVNKLIFPVSGGCAIILNIANGISGLVPEMHLSDIHLQHPDRKFKEGLSVNARVLSVDLERRQIRLTLKKSLVNTDAEIWTRYEQVKAGSSSQGTILKLDANGALMQFYGDVRGFLPTAEMSDAFIEDARAHFRVGQVVNVVAQSVDATSNRIRLSCRSQAAMDASNTSIISGLKVGQLVSGFVSAKSEEDVSVDLKGIHVKATMPLFHASDGSLQKMASSMKHIRVGQTLHDLVIVEIFMKKLSVVVSNKPSLVRAARSGKTTTELERLEENDVVDGFVRNITSDGIFVQTVWGLTGLLPKSQIPEDKSGLPDFGMTKGQSISARVLSVDIKQNRFTLSMRPIEVDKTPNSTSSSVGVVSVVNPVDGVSDSMADFAVGKITKGRITAVKGTQLNVQLADNVQGRIDVSEIYSKWEDIKDRMHPLRSFRANDIVDVRILGIHDARNHRFLPISHRGGKVPVFELSAKMKDDQSLLSLEQIKPGSWHMAFVNNCTESSVWVNLSPSVRGRIEHLNLTEDVSALGDVEKNFPTGCALRVRVTHVDVQAGHLDLSARTSAENESLTLDNLAEGMITAGRVTRVTERSLLVQLSPDLVGHVGLTELADDYSLVNPAKYKKNDIIRVCVLSIDRANKKLVLATRPSKVLSSSLPVQDRLITDISSLTVNAIVRGFVKNVADVGLFIALSYKITGFVRVSDISDSFVKDWKAIFEVDRLVTGKVIAVEAASGNVQLSLKESIVSADYIPKLTFDDIEVGQVITGKVRKVEDFGAFIVVDNSNNVSGLCHRSEIAERRVEDVRKVYEEGDLVKAIVLKIDPEKRRISFGLKASYFETASMEEESDGSDDGGADLNMEDAEESDFSIAEDDESDEELLDQPNTLVASNVDGDITAMPQADLGDDDGLATVGFNWDGTVQRDDAIYKGLRTADDAGATPEIKHRRSRAHEDITGDMDLEGPQTVDDFERLLLGKRHSSELWVQYMSFYVGQGQIEEARKIVERALKEIPIREQDEKKQVWFAYLNLETNFGSDDAADEVFKRACEYNDVKEMHEHFASGCIRAGKIAKAEQLYQAMTKKKDCSGDTKFWINYADFLFEKMSQPDRARALVKRADQSVVLPQLPSGVQSKLRRDLICKFAQLEFKAQNGDAERGRNSFEDLVTTYPRQWDVWDIYVEMEKHHGTAENVRGLYERMTSQRMNKRRAAFVFKQWLSFEEKNGDTSRQDHVKARATAAAEQLKVAQGGSE